MPTKTPFQKAVAKLRFGLSAKGKSAEKFIVLRPDEAQELLASIDASPDRLTEMSFAYERAAGIIESCCVIEETNGLEQYYDLDSSDEDLADEVAYLDSRRLLERHSKHPRWVMIGDEGEPMPVTGKGAA